MSLDVKYHFILLSFLSLTLVLILSHNFTPMINNSGQFNFVAWFFLQKHLINSLSLIFFQIVYAHIVLETRYVLMLPRVDDQVIRPLG